MVPSTACHQREPRRPAGRTSSPEQAAGKSPGGAQWRGFQTENESSTIRALASIRDYA